MKILVTGGSGFLGTRVVKRLLAQGFTDIRCTLRDESKRAALEEIASHFPLAKVECITANLCSRAECVGAVDGVSLVVHLAAGLKGAAADLFMNSVVASNNLLRALAARPDFASGKVRVVLVSSFGVYGVAEQPRRALVSEETPLESKPELRDVYSYSKLRQELLFREWASKDQFELVVLRPGVIYGPGGGHLSSRVGLQIGPFLLHLGGRNLLPLSYVENCADAIVLAATHPEAAGQTYNVHDDELMTCAKFLSQYKKSVKKLRSIRVPYRAALFLAWILEKYRRRSLGQIPAVFTPYKVASAWKGNRFSNKKLHSLGWSPSVSTEVAVARTFDSLRQDLLKNVR